MLYVIQQSWDTILRISYLYELPKGEEGSVVGFDVVMGMENMRRDMMEGYDGS